MCCDGSHVDLILNWLNIYKLPFRTLEIKEFYSSLQHLHLAHNKLTCICTFSVRSLAIVLFTPEQKGLVMNEIQQRMLKKDVAMPEKESWTTLSKTKNRQKGQ